MRTELEKMLAGELYDFSILFSCKHGIEPEIFARISMSLANESKTDAGRS
ncbi:MAG: hypothetical protein U0744_18680 [Gemmataceae bacterium]